MCAAARIFDAVRRKAAENNPDSKGQFDSIHVRRGDFQFKINRVSAEIIYNQIKEKKSLRELRFILPLMNVTSPSLSLSKKSTKFTFWTISNILSKA